MQPLSILTQQALVNLEYRSKAALSGLPSGFEALDRLTGGFEAGDLIILAARPSMGKSVLALSMLRHVTVEQDLPAILFSLESTAEQVTNRLLAAQTGIDSERIRKGALYNYEWEFLHQHVPKLTKAPLYLNDSAGLTLSQLIKVAREYHQEHGLALLVVDYLQLIAKETSPVGQAPSANREQEISEIVRELKHLAKELTLPIIALSQLNRSVETRGGDRRPQLSDLRDSGALEEAADLVLFLYRPEYYGILQDEMGNPTYGQAELIVAKNRYGFLDSIGLSFSGRTASFGSSESSDLPPLPDIPIEFSRAKKSSRKKASDSGVTPPPPFDEPPF